MVTYSTPASSCDVVDKVRLAQFRKFREQASYLLKDDEDHSIWAQLLQLFWHDAAFRSFNEARRTNTAERKNAAIAPVLARYIDNAYVEGEVLGISRLTDPHNEDAGRGVVSLPTIIKLLRDNQACITRETFVCYDGLPFDDKAAAEMENAAVPYVEGVTSMPVQPSDYSRWAHELFDRLSGKPPHRRHRDDTVKPGLLKWLNRQLQGADIQKIRQHRNKVLAHPADRASRGGGAADRLGLTLNAIDALHRRLLEVGEVLSWVCLGEELVGSPIPIPQFDQFEGFDRVFAFPEDLPSLGRFWSEMTSDREDWARSALGAAPTKVPKVIKAPR
jgi:hypothetical protein